MLERVWRKRNPLTLLVGVQTSTAAMENSVEISFSFHLKFLFRNGVIILVFPFTFSAIIYDFLENSYLVLD